MPVTADLQPSTWHVRSGCDVALLIHESHNLSLNATKSTYLQGLMSEPSKSCDVNPVSWTVLSALSSAVVDPYILEPH